MLQMNYFIVANSLSVANIIDIVVLVLLFVFCITGTMRGLTGELARLLGLSATMATGILFYSPLRHQMPSDEFSWTVISVAVTVLVAVAAGTLVYLIIRKFLKIIIGQPTDAIMGGIFATITTSIIIYIILFFLYSVPGKTLNKTLYENTVSGRLAKPLIEYTHDKMNIHKNKFSTGENK